MEIKMERSYLIQRLLAPVDYTPLSFGGGLRNGGLSEKAMELLRGVWSFDYMGSAEFEFGAVRDALEKMVVDQLNLVCGFEKTFYRYYDHYSDSGNNPLQEGHKTVFYLCRKIQEREVKKRIGQFAIADTSNVRTKETVMLDRAMSGCDYKDSRRCIGWLEIDNGYMFFTDEKMWRGACQLFGVRTPSKKKVSKKK